MQFKLKKFKKTVWDYYCKYGRKKLSWRHTRDPYKILVSEVMLQQTQVARVLKYYPKFLEAFPSFEKLARASLKKVLRVWQGMGYNRRAVALKKLASIIIDHYGGELPRDVETLKSLPGIGPATAGAIMAYAFSKPSVFIETNIRRVFIHEFFARRKKINDRETLRLVELTVGRKNPREWYWALTDYGTMLAAREKENPNVRSTAYRKQPKFEGSNRQARGRVLKLLLARGRVAKKEMRRFQAVVPELIREGFIRIKNGTYRLGRLNK